MGSPGSGLHRFDVVPHYRDMIDPKLGNAVTIPGMLKRAKVNFREIRKLFADTDERVRGLELENQELKQRIAFIEQQLQTSLSKSEGGR